MHRIRLAIYVLITLTGCGHQSHDAFDDRQIAAITKELNK